MALEPDSLDSCECAEGAPAWMATFSDLATLLLTFFVLLLSFAEMDVVEYREMLGSVREAFGVQFDRQGSYEAMSTTVVELAETDEVPWSPLSERQIWSLQAVERFIKQRNLSSDVDVGMSERGVVIRLKDRLAFDAGDAALRETAQEVLREIWKLTDAFPGTMSVEGHTDDQPIRSAKFPSNWELSTARAIAVLRYMESLGPMPNVTPQVAGHADRDPLGPNDTPEQRALNRRVEFVFEKPEWGTDPEALRKAQQLMERVEQRGAAAGNRGAAPGPALGSPAGVDVGPLPVIAPPVIDVNEPLETTP